MTREIHRERCLIYDIKIFSTNEVNESVQSASLVRSVILYRGHLLIKCRLLRVLIHWQDFEIQNVNLRYFEGSTLPSSLSLIWNLQTLKLHKEFSAPLEIWKLTQLRHLKCRNWLLLPEPPLSDNEDNSFVLGNLETLATVLNFRVSKDIYKRIPNIKKLCLMYHETGDGYEDGLYGTLQNLGRLNKLESLNIRCIGATQVSTKELKNAFPSSLHKLVLQGCRLNWDELPTIVGSLRQLEYFKLDKNFSEVRTWTCFGGGFLRLKFLSIEGIYLKSWTLDNPSCFPVLEKLVLVNFLNFSQIPSGIKEIPTLQLIRLEDCHPSVAIWAMKIKEEQESFGNYGLLIQASLTSSQEMRLRERVEIERLSINNIHLELCQFIPRKPYEKEWTVIYNVFRWLFAIKRMMARKRWCESMDLSLTL